MSTCFKIHVYLDWYKELKQNKNNGSHCAMCPSHIWICFYPEIIYFFLVQFILNELSSSHFPISEIFVKISSLESLTTYHPENRKNIPTISEFDETFLGHWISRDESNDSVRLVIRHLENFLGFPEPLWQFIIIIIIIPVLKISNFPGFYIMGIAHPVMEIKITGARGTTGNEAHLGPQF